MVYFSFLGRFGRDAGSREVLGRGAARSGAGAARNGAVDAFDAVDAAPVFWMRWRPLWVTAAPTGSREGPSGVLRWRTAPGRVRRCVNRAPHARRRDAGVGADREASGGLRAGRPARRRPRGLEMLQAWAALQAGGESIIWYATVFAAPDVVTKR